MNRTSPPLASRASPVQNRERVREMSKLVLGNLDRLDVGAAIAASEDGMVNATDLQGKLGIAQSRVRSQLMVMERAGLLTAFPRSAGKRWYKRRESVFWEVCLALYREWSG